MTNRVITMSYVLRDFNSKSTLEKSPQPIKFVSGLGQIMPKLEEELLNLKEGNKKTIAILAKRCRWW